MGLERLVHLQMTDLEEAKTPAPCLKLIQSAEKSRVLELILVHKCLRAVFIMGRPDVLSSPT